MVERLAYLSTATSANHQPHGSGAGAGYNHPPMFNPRSVSFDIHTPEELAAVNEFLITLGREVTTTTRAHALLSRHQARDFDDHSSHSYFNPAGLSELGLAGMPGIMNSAAGSGASFNDAAIYSTSSAAGFPHYSRQTHQPVTVPGINFAAPQPTSLFPDIPIPFFPDLASRRETDSFTSAVSTPSSMSDAKLESPPPFLSRSAGYQSPEMLSPHSNLSTPPTGIEFDFLRPSRGPPPISQITPFDYPTRTLRPVLKTVPPDGRNRTEPSPSKPLRPTHTPSRSGADKLHYLLTSGSGNEECTLAPLHLRRERSSSPSTSSSRSGSSTPEPHQSTVLPSLKSVTSGISTERLASSVRDIEIDSQVDDEDEPRSTHGEGIVDKLDVQEERQEHVRLIKDLLVYFNSEYKKRHGVPGGNKDRLVGSRTLMGPGVPGVHVQRSLSSMDVEMTAV